MPGSTVSVVEVLSPTRSPDTVLPTTVSKSNVHSGLKCTLTPMGTASVNASPGVVGLLRPMPEWNATTGTARPMCPPTVGPDFAGAGAGAGAAIGAAIGAAMGAAAAGAGSAAA